MKWTPTEEELKYVAMAALAGIQVVRRDNQGWSDNDGTRTWVTPSRAAVQALHRKGLISVDELTEHMRATDHYLETGFGVVSVNWAEIMGAMT